MGESWGDMSESKVVQSMITTTMLNRYFSLLDVSTRHIKADDNRYIVSLKNNNNMITSNDWVSLIDNMRRLKYDFWYMEVDNQNIVIWFTRALN